MPNIKLNRISHLKHVGVVCSTYFAEGLPFMLVRWLCGVYFTKIGARDAFIGYLNWLSIFWNLKFLWAPAIDFYGSSKRWIVALEALMTAVMLLVSYLSFMGPPMVSLGALKKTWNLAEFAEKPAALGCSQASVLLFILGLFIVMAFLSATHDIAIDAYYLQRFKDPSFQAAYSGVRSFAYRLAVIFAKVALIGYSFFYVGFLLSAAVLGLLCLIHAFCLSPLSSQSNHKQTVSIKQAWSSYLSQPQIKRLLVFIVGYKLGDEVLFSMNTPFLLRELLVSDHQYAWLSGIVGTTAFIAATTVSGLLMSRYGLKKMIWPLSLLMNLAIWAYVLLAYIKPNAQTALGFGLITWMHAIEYAASGAGSAALTMVLLKTCRSPVYQASHFAIGSALMTLGGTLLGGFSGTLIESYGYFWFYVFAFMCAIPSMITLCFIDFNLMDKA